MELTRAEVETMLDHADAVRTKLRRATRELMRFGEEALAAREGYRRTDGSSLRASECSSDGDRSR
jgi:hypothetical protein